MIKISLRASWTQRGDTASDIDLGVSCICLRIFTDFRGAGLLRHRALSLWDVPRTCPIVSCVPCQPPGLRLGLGCALPAPPPASKTPGDRHRTCEAPAPPPLRSLCVHRLYVCKHAAMRQRWAHVTMLVNFTNRCQLALCHLFANIFAACS